MHGFKNIHRGRVTRALAALAHAAGITLLVAACGGGSEPAGSPATAPQQQRPKPFWESDSGVRPEVEQLLNRSPNPDAPVIALTVDEAGKVRQSAVPAKAVDAAPRAAKAASKIVHRRPVSGMESVVYHTSLGSTTELSNLSFLDVKVHAPDGNGGFEEIPASSRNADGTYVVTGVPEGSYWISLGGLEYVWTSEPFVDWGFDAFGRANVAIASIPPVGLDIQARGLSPWQADDDLQYVVPNHGVTLSLLPDGTDVLANPPATGETALVNFGFDFHPWSIGLLSASAGDQAYLNQLTRRPGDLHRSLVRSMVLPALEMTDGTTTAVNSSFRDIPVNDGFPLQWQRSAYASLAASVNPSAALATSAVTVYAFETPQQFGLPGGAFTLAEYAATGSSDVDFGTLSFGNPFPDSWNRVVTSAVMFDVAYMAPGATTPVLFRRGLYSEEQLGTAAAPAPVQLSPRMSPVQQPKINGKSLFQNQLAVGTTPRLSWSKPTIGTPKQYFVRLSRLINVESQSLARSVAFFNTTETQLTVPPGLMQPGETYFFTIAAIRSGNSAIGPRRLTLPYAFATLMSGIVSP